MSAQWTDVAECWKQNSDMRSNPLWKYRLHHNLSSTLQCNCENPLEILSWDKFDSTVLNAEQAVCGPKPNRFWHQKIFTNQKIPVLNRVARGFSGASENERTTRWINWGTKQSDNWNDPQVWQSTWTFIRKWDCEAMAEDIRWSWVVSWAEIWDARAGVYSQRDQTELRRQKYTYYNDQQHKRRTRQKEALLWRSFYK